MAPIKATYRFTSLTVIAMMKIMCNSHAKKPNILRERFGSSPATAY
jgi:hypothetical protein